MKVLHLTGHFQKWNLDSYFQNSIGDGFVFCAYSFEEGFFAKDKVNGYVTDEILAHSFFDLQYYGKKEGGNIQKGKLGTYPFHPTANAESAEQTNVFIESLIKQGITYQIDNLGLKNVIIPNYYENERPNEDIGLGHIALKSLIVVSIPQLLNEIAADFNGKIRILLIDGSNGGREGALVLRLQHDIDHLDELAVPEIIRRNMPYGGLDVGEHAAKLL